MAVREEAMGKILVTGALGRVGRELVPALRDRYGVDRVVASDNRAMPADGSPGPFEPLDCTQIDHVHDVVRRHDVGTVYHFAALLSAAAEENPQLAWSVNVGGLHAVLEVARQYGCAVFLPSSIGAFGPTTPPIGTPQDTVQRPTTLYGVTKVVGELLCDDYARRCGLDARGLRLPCLISQELPLGGGTTDYAVEIFHHAIRHRHYTCRLAPDTRLDMMYMPDAVAAIIGLMEAEEARLIHRNAFNVTAMNFTPGRLAAEIAKHIPEFTIDYDVDPVRQAVADSWPRSIDDTAARAEWDWSPAHDLESMTRDMVEKIGERAGP
jgi:nucleoside-diphosphate-sugar epimerase